MVAITGAIPDREDYGEWLLRQPNAFQNSVLGIRKAGLFRRGTLALDEFVDRVGNELTLDELEALHPNLFGAP
jgi:hypothetical protein